MAPSGVVVSCCVKTFPTSFETWRQWLFFQSEVLRRIWGMPFLAFVSAQATVLWRVEGFSKVSLAVFAMERWNWWMYLLSSTNNPIGSMFGIFTYIYHKNHPIAGKYTSPMDPSWESTIWPIIFHQATRPKSNCLYISVKHGLNFPRHHRWSNGS